ncbi:MAG: ATP-binding protein [candidate division Zixibacteria bacterium]|nr:ATP-binding protein [candidate division Zixibacteria bacterium]
MSLTTRIRIYLIAVAVLPSLVLMAVIYLYTTRQNEISFQRQALEDLQRYIRFNDSYKQTMQTALDSLVISPFFIKALHQIKTGHANRARLDPRPFGMDFMELLDTNGCVLATYHRTGLLAKPLNTSSFEPVPEHFSPMETMEYDLWGGHPSYTFLIPVERHLFLYTGRYLDFRWQKELTAMLEAQITLVVDSLSRSPFGNMEKNTLYKDKDTFQAVLAGGKDKGFYAVAVFYNRGDRSLFYSLLSSTGLVALLSVIVAVALGIYVTSRAKREINNLVAATSRVASGDFNTPVMAYEEGEFSRLADAFTEMTIRLKALKRELATVEKIAAWETIGRKIAHEIKNPLTPIAVSTDDLRHAYFEKLPDFEKTLKETTTTIKSEVTRLTAILDEFVSFARLKAPNIIEVAPAAFIDGIKNLYRSESQSGRLTITDYSRLYKFKFDPEAITQVLINLIKNGLESSPGACLKVVFDKADEHLIITVEDNGPGFSEARLADSFKPFATTKENGSGLGLVICHRLVHDHGGSMELYNIREGGAGVRITLPLI